MTQSVSSSVVAIDIGTTKVSVIIARVKDHETIDVIGMSCVDNHAIKKGKITDLNLLTDVIKQAVAEAEEKARCRVHHVWVSIPSYELYCAVNDATVGISQETISTTNMVEARDIAKNKCIKPDYYVTNAIPLAYYVDNAQDPVVEPLGMVAHQLEAHYHFIMMPINVMQNIRQALKNANIKVNQIVVSPLATATSCLLEDEKREGVCLLDIGADITNLVVYLDGKMILVHHLEMGGELITQDIQNTFQVSYDEANKLKLKYGTLDYDSFKPEQMIKLRLLNGEHKTISRADLVEVIMARYRYILRHSYRILVKENLAQLPRGIVLTGGATQIEHIVKVAKEEFHQPIHLANKYEYIVHRDPSQQALLATPSYQTAVGLAVFSQIDKTSTSQESISDVPQGFWFKLSQMWQSFVQLFKKVV